MSMSIEIDTNVKVTDKGTTSLTVTAIGNEMPSKVFAIEVLPGSAHPQNAHYRFSHVCHPSELLEMPDEPSDEYCYFRTDEVEFIFDTAIPVECVKKSILSDVEYLVRELGEDLKLDGSSSKTVIGDNTTLKSVILVDMDVDTPRYKLREIQLVNN